MSSPNSSSEKSFNSSNSYINNQKENLNSSLFLCPKCQTAITSISVKREKVSKNFNINILCKNNHREEMPLSKFNMLNQKTDSKECENCKKKSTIKNIYYCHKCKKYFCLNCKCEHFEKNANLFTNYFGLLENRCTLHDNKINQYYCKDCAKYLCKDCFKDHLKEHKNIINLMEKFNKYVQLITNEIANEKNLMIKYNEILNSVRKIITKNIEQKRKALEIKKSILNSYISNNMNYFNIKNMDYAKENLNNNLLPNQNKIKKLYDICKKDYIDAVNNKK
jgi:hypothetical protein